MAFTAKLSFAFNIADQLQYMIKKMLDYQSISLKNTTSVHHLQLFGILHRVIKHLKWLKIDP